MRERWKSPKGRLEGSFGTRRSGKRELNGATQDHSRRRQADHSRVLVIVVVDTVSRGPRQSQRGNDREPQVEPRLHQRLMQRCQRRRETIERSVRCQRSGVPQRRLELGRSEGWSASSLQRSSSRLYCLKVGNPNVEWSKHKTFQHGEKGKKRRKSGGK